MNSLQDDFFNNLRKTADAQLKKSAAKLATKKSHKVEFTGPDGSGEGEATVEVAHDTERYFVAVSVHIPYEGQKTLVSVDDDNLGSALSKAEQKFSEENHGAISLEWLAEK